MRNTNMKNTKGFSIVEVVVSAGAFAVFAILIQNVLLLAHSFQLSQKNLLDTFQITQVIKQKVCVANLAFQNRNIAKDSSYVRKITTKTEGVDEDNQAILSHHVSYEKLSASADKQPVLRLSFATEDPAKPPATKDVSQDSHTLVTFNFDSQTLQKSVGNKSMEFLSGYIFASRCVPVKESSIKLGANDYKATFDTDDLNASVGAILGLTYRPYYFAQSKKGGGLSVRCCVNGADTGTCQSAIEQYVPRVYVLHFVRDGNAELSLPTDPDFAGNVQAIQELPELHDMDTLWGAGFMVSMTQKRIFSQSSFNLDIMILKNTCSTSLGHVKNCPLLSLAKNPAQQELIGLAGSGMHAGDFIVPDISSCSGHVSGVDTSSAVIFQY